MAKKKLTKIDTKQIASKETKTKLEKTNVFLPLSKIEINDKTFNGLLRYKESVNHIQMPSISSSLGEILS